MLEIQKMLSAGIQNFLCSSMPGKQVKGGGTIQLSKHEALEFFFVIRGESRFQIEDKVFDTRPGDMCVIEPWAVHSYGFCAEDHDLLQLWLHLDRERLRIHFIQVEEQGRFKSFMAPIVFSCAMTDMLRKRWHLAKSKGDITPESLNKYLRCPLTFIMEEVMLEQEQKAEKNGNSNIDIVESIKQFIIDRQGCGCALEKLEEFTGYSKFYIAHLFKKKTGLTIGRFINNIRVEYAAEAEIHGLPYKEIANQLGFSSIQAFSPWNRKHRREIAEFKARILPDLAEYGLSSVFPR